MKQATEPCPTCGHPWPAPVARACARDDCGNEFRFRRIDAVYCSQRCARIVAQRALRKRRRKVRQGT